ncbi:MAG: amino acid ABC transporter substrate-binding protein [Acidimicrobiales bacterium]
MTNRSRWWSWLAGLAALLLFTAACSEDEPAADDDNGEEAVGGGGQQAGGLLDEVRERGTLRCGVNDTIPGFGFADDQGNFAGFDIDYCRVIAAGILGDADAVEFVAITAPEQRFPALQSGDIDVLVRNTTWTASRDGELGAAFVATTFYDGQGMMVRVDSGVTEIDGLANRTICTTTGTTTELNLTTRMTGIPYTPRNFQDNDQIREAFIQEQCDAWTSDKSQLAAHRSTFPDAEGGPDALVILEETFSKEPLGPAVRDGDQAWFDAVQWTIFATMQAEEFGISQENLDQMLESEDPAVERFLGLEVGDPPAPFDPQLGLDPDFAVNIVQLVGNYGEIYERNLGSGTPLGLIRDNTQNALWTDGGLIYAPPYT